MPSIYRVTLAVVCIALITTECVSQTRKDKKNIKISEAENERYQEDLKEHPNSAEPHWRHANIVAKFDFKDAEEAWRYYDKALKIDSTTAALWSDFGEYLLKVHNDQRNSLYLFERALKLEPDSKVLQNKVTELKRNVDAIQETIRLRSIGRSDRRKIDHDIKYSVISDFDSLQALTTNPDGLYSYHKLLKRFLEDDLMSEWETYLLCLGYAKTEAYSPYSDVPGDLYELNKAGKYSETLSREREVLKKNPVSGSIYRELMYAHRRTGDDEIADRYKRRAQRLYDVMIFTGDGTCEKPYVTLSASEEYQLISYLGLFSTGSQALVSCTGGEADLLDIQDREGKRGELYFCVSLLFKKMGDVFQKK